MSKSTIAAFRSTLKSAPGKSSVEAVLFEKLYGEIRRTGGIYMVPHMNIRDHGSAPSRSVKDAAVPAYRAFSCGAIGGTSRLDGGKLVFEIDRAVALSGDDHYRLRRSQFCRCRKASRNYHKRSENIRAH